MKIKHEKTSKEELNGDIRRQRLNNRADVNRNINHSEGIKRNKNTRRVSESENNKTLNNINIGKNKSSKKGTVIKHKRVKTGSLDNNDINNKRVHSTHKNTRDADIESKYKREKTSVKRNKVVKHNGNIKKISVHTNHEDINKRAHKEKQYNEADFKNKKNMVKKSETGRVKSEINKQGVNKKKMKPADNREKMKPKSQHIENENRNNELNGLNQGRKSYINKARHSIKNKKYNKIIKIIIAAIIIILVVVFGINEYNNAKRINSYENTEIKQTLYINNREFETKDPFKVRDNVIYAPIEEIVKGLGKNISYDKSITGTIKIHYNGEEYEAKTGSNEVYSVSTDETSDIKGCIEIIDDKLYAPMEFIKEVMPINIMKSDDNEVFIDVFNDQFDYSWTKDNIYIAHAMGGIDGHDYTNSLEAFERNYEKGYRVFEADIAMTKDDEPVLLHAWSEKSTKQLGLPSAWGGKAATYNDFMSQKINGMYTPLSFEDLCNLMKEHDDMRVVLDLKTDVSEAKDVYGKLIEVARSVGDPTVLDRLIPQIYEEEMCDVVMDVYDFKSMIYSLYKQPYLDADSVVDFAYKKGIRVVVIDRRKFNLDFINEVNKRGLMVYTNTYNMPDAVARLKRRGIKGFFSDFINPVTEKNPYIEEETKEQ